MINRSIFLEIYGRAIAPVVARMDQSKWDIARALTLGGAGLSTALIFVVTQTGVVTPALRVSLLCASLGVPTWLALWRVGEAYSFFGPKSYGHFASPRASGVGILLLFAGIALLLVSSWPSSGISPYFLRWYSSLPALRWSFLRSNIRRRFNLGRSERVPMTPNLIQADGSAAA